MKNCFVTTIFVLFLVKSEAHNYGDIKYCSRSCPLLPPGTIGPCIELCGDGCPPSEGCCSNGCGHTCQPLRAVEGYGDQCPKDPRIKNDIKYCSRSCPILPPGTIGPCIELCGDGCPPGEGCCSNGCGHTCQPLRPVKGYGDQCPKDPTVKNDDDLRYPSESYPDRWCSNECKVGEVSAGFVDGRFKCIRGEENTCARTLCPVGTMCKLQRVMCFAPPCYPIAQCLP